MNTNFHSQSRVWLYLSNRSFSNEEIPEINSALKYFCNEWTAHGSNLTAHGAVLHRRFILLMVDESVAGASGCSIDKSVHFIQQVEKEFGVQLFNRMLFAWREGEEIHVSNLNEVQKLFDEGVINHSTIVFDTLVATKKDFDERFEISFGDSWMMKRIRTTKQIV